MAGGVDVSQLQPAQTSNFEYNWYFAFTKGEIIAPWYVKLFHRNTDFKHIIAFAQCDNFVLIINPSVTMLGIEIKWHPEGKDKKLYAGTVAYEFAKNGATVVQITTEEPPEIRSLNLTYLLPTCVTVCKYLIGVSPWFVHTPYQFYKYLLDNGGEPVEL